MIEIGLAPSPEEERRKLSKRELSSEKSERSAETSQINRGGRARV
jgi:uncharacterized protein (DUF2384 family)